MNIANPKSGVQRRDETLSGVRDRRPLDVWRAQLAMLEAMLRRVDRTGTSDDMTPHGQQNKNNAPWLGAAVRQLAEQDLIVRVGIVRSKRPSRKANEIKRWNLSSDIAAALKIRELRQLLEALTTGDRLSLLLRKSETSTGATVEASIQKTFPAFEKGFTDGQTL